MRHAILVALAACDAGLDQRLAIVDEPRVLAVIAEPAEAKPGEPITYSAVAASPDGPLAAVPHWAYCTAPKPPTEDNVVSDACLADPLLDLGTAAQVTAMLPADGCQTFGPDTPPGGFRPRDADPTGGYYQPIRADVDPLAAGRRSLIAFGLSRITCKLPTAPPDIAREYDTMYIANANPTFAAQAPADVVAGSDATLEVSWPADAAESYLYFDPLAQRLVTRREAMRLSWFATAGVLDVDASAVDEDDPSTTVSTTWHTPSGPGGAHLWFVLRDSRGGIAVHDLAITVR